MLFQENRIDRFKDDYAFLSNFYPLTTPIPYTAVFPGKQLQTYSFSTAEHAYVAAKTTDVKERAFTTTLPYPGQAKIHGRKLKLRDDWDAIKLMTMWEILLLKFNLNPDLKRKLIATGNAALVEGNWHGDKYWGVSNRDGEGENHLGRLLMELRDYFNDMGDM